MKTVTLYFTFLLYASQLVSQGVNTSIECKKEGIEYYRKRDFQKAEFSFRNCIELAKTEKDWRSLGQCYNNLGSVLFQRGSYAEGIISYENATQVYSENKLDTLLGESYLNLGLAYKKQNIYDSAIVNFYRGIGILEALQVNVSLLKGYNMLANTLRETASLNKARVWYLRALQIAQGEGNHIEIGSIYNNIGTLLKKEGKPDSAIIYYKKSLTMKTDGQSKGLGNSYFNLGETYSTLKQIDSAIANYQESVKYRLIAKDNFGLAHSNLGLARAFITTGNLDFARDHLGKAKTLVGSVSSKDLHLKYLETERDYFLSTGRYLEAGNLNDKIQQIRDEILNKDKQDLITSYEIQYDVQKLRETIISKNQVLTWAFTLAGLLFITGIFLYRERQKKKKAAEIIETLFKDMHHRVKNNLSLLNGVITFRRRALNDISARSILKDISGQVDTINLIHQRLYLQHGEKVGNIDLSQYLQELVENVFVSSGIDSGDYDLVFELCTAQVAADKANPIGLIVNEVVTNTIKHGKSSDNRWYFNVNLISKDDNIEIRMGDKGQGLGHGDNERNESGGVKLIEILCGQINAELGLVVDKGTQYVLRFKK
ncbi:Two-component sensor histidine kinase, contains HisKA and HATPase domains [Reichenbachiella faecimaris]|uniref:Two-component sensor histidine kinase, contains HisKA and HATPase domains n=1 Tax=Reichenbachiella faecimaris TaxID=692418 RepID=A0A1W2GHD6_REIFA|nr:tetratricopeptide repeat protein [Reichenbachiella faecimaris]SMD36057.1 Two-component sensor histidine kinase, contains HisKA and HATPase domains [Reichenbachiella faecimaris]